jgi:hypothetical protein
MFEKPNVGMIHVSIQNWAYPFGTTRSGNVSGQHAYSQVVFVPTVLVDKRLETSPNLNERSFN